MVPKVIFGAAFWTSFPQVAFILTKMFNQNDSSSCDQVPYKAKQFAFLSRYFQYCDTSLGISESSERTGEQMFHISFELVHSLFEAQL